jgi:predicted Zn-dependent protease
MDPKDTVGRLHIVQILSEQGRKAEAWKELNDALHLHPDDLALYPLLEQLAEETQRQAEYESLLRALAGRNTPQEEPTKQLVSYLKRKDRAEDAWQFVESRLNQQPKNPYLLDLAIQLQEGFGRYKESLPLYERLVPSRLRDVSFLRQYSLRTEQYGTLPQILRAYELSLDANPSDISAALKLAQFYVKANRKGEAIDLLRRFHENYPLSEEVKQLLEELEKPS